jgi:hypothetical protein
MNIKVNKCTKDLFALPEKHMSAVLLPREDVFGILLVL